MSHFAALEVVIGLSFVYFVFSLICSGVTESIASHLNWRSRMLEVAIENFLSGTDSITKEGQELAKDFWKHPLIQSLARPKKEKLLRSGRPPRPEDRPDAAIPRDNDELTRGAAGRTFATRPR